MSYNIAKEKVKAVRASISNYEDAIWAPLEHKDLANVRSSYLVRIMLSQFPTTACQMFLKPRQNQGGVQ